MSEKLIKVGISHGDFNGIGYELILRTFEDARIFDFCIPVVYGSSKVLAFYRKAMELQPMNVNTINHANEAGANRLNILNCIDEELKVEHGKSTAEAGNASSKALAKAMDDLQSGAIDVLLTAPVNRQNISSEDAGFEGQSRYIESRCAEKGRNALMLFVKDGLRIALATAHVPLSEVSPLLTVDLIANKLKDLKQSLVRDFSLTLTRIAVLSFNPRGAKEDWMGKEEKEIIMPALEAATKEGVCCFGPYAADDFFGSGYYKQFDAVLAMYHDQGLLPFKTLASEEGVLFTAGLPVVRTAPCNGVQYEIAGQNKANEASFRNALYLAVDVFKNRKLDDKIKANPLKRQYFERGSDNEKLDLTKEDPQE